jgi:hypothetical protein
VRTPSRTISGVPTKEHILAEIRRTAEANGEWFELNRADIAAFKRRRKFM